MDKSSGQSKYDDNSAYSKLKRLDTELYTTQKLNYDKKYRISNAGNENDEQKMAKKAF